MLMLQSNFIAITASQRQRQNPSPQITSKIRKSERRTQHTSPTPKCGLAQFVAIANNQFPKITYVFLHVFEIRSYVHTFYFIILRTLQPSTRTILLFYCIRMGKKKPATTPKTDNKRRKNKRTPGAKLKIRANKFSNDFKSKAKTRLQIWKEVSSLRGLL